MKESSSGPRVKDASATFWKICLALVLITVVVITICYAVSESEFWGYRPEAEDVFAMFLILSLGGAFVLAFAFVIREALEGFGELVSDTREIKELLNLARTQQKKEAEAGSEPKEVKKPVAASVAAAASSGGVDNDGNWVCPKCGTVNKYYNARCYMCSQAKTN